MPTILKNLESTMILQLSCHGKAANNYICTHTSLLSNVHVYMLYGVL